MSSLEFSPVLIRTATWEVVVYNPVTPPDAVRIKAVLAERAG
ncbi:hypothetical protein [Bradyrhizobium genosp. A]